MTYSSSNTTILVLSLQQKLILGLVTTLLAFVSWSGRDTLTGLREDVQANTLVLAEVKQHLSLVDQAVAVLDNELRHLDAGLASLEAKVEVGTEDRYRAADAERDFRMRDNELQHLGQRVSKLEEIVGRGPKD